MLNLGPNAKPHLPSGKIVPPFATQFGSPMKTELYVPSVPYQGCVASATVTPLVIFLKLVPSPLTHIGDKFFADPGIGDLSRVLYATTTFASPH